MDETLVRLGIVTILLWLASRLYELARTEMTRRAERRSFLRALFAEVDFNTRDMELFLAVSPDLARLRHALESQPDLVPHITDARHTQIYNANIGLLHHLENTLIAEMVTFYGALEKIRTQIEGVARPSFKTISVDGQMQTIEELMTTCNDCRRSGARILTSMQRSHPELALARFLRPAQDTRSLTERLQQLQSDLDRVGAGHRASSA